MNHRPHRTARGRRSTLTALALLLACDPGQDTAKTEGAKNVPATPAAPAPDPAEGVEAVPGAGAGTAPANETPTGVDAILPWLDPEARAVLLVRDLPYRLDPESLAVVFALAPSALRLLEDLAAVETGLSAMLGDSGESAPAAWLGTSSMVMTPSVATGNTLVFQVSAPKSKIIEWMSAGGMSKSGIDGFDVLQPRRGFRFKVVFLTDDVLAFVPASEIGSGTGPLTAARDLPPSEMRTQLKTLLDEDPGVVMALHSGGPSLHLDLSDDVVSTQFGVKHVDGSLQGQVLIQTTGTIETAIKELNGRQHPEESNQIQALMKRVVFGAEGTMAAAREVLTREDIIHLERR